MGRPGKTALKQSVCFSYVSGLGRAGCMID